MVKKKKTDDFEVSIFLTETETRHSLLHKQKHLRSKLQTKLKSNSSKLTGHSAEAPIDLDGANDGDAGGDYDDDLDVLILREEDEEGGDGDLHLADIPAINETATYSTTRGAKRRRQGGEEGNDVMEIEDSDHSDNEQDDGLFVNSGSEDDNDNDASPPNKRLKKYGDGPEAAAAVQNDKKKMAMDISYEGFAIYGRVLCLVVKRRDGNTKSGGRSIPPGGVGNGGGGAGRPGGQAVMENWISSTQIPIADQDGEDAGDE